MKIIKFLLLAIGFYILYITIRAVGIEHILSNIVALRWKLLPLLFIYSFIFFFDTIGWSFAFPKSLPRHIPFWDLYRIRIVGETLNAVIPWAASLGGEPVKTQLLKTRYNVPLAEGYASILIVHTTFWISLNIFIIGAILATLRAMPLTPVLWQSVMIFLFVLGIIAALLVIGLHFGIFKKVHRVGESLKWWGDKSEEKKHRFLQLDSEIKKFYTSDPRRFLASIFFNFIGWFVGVFEVYWIAKILHIPINFAEAWLFEALIQVLRIITFIIPSSIGTQEGGIVLIFVQFGLDKSLGLMFAIVRRMREIVWLSFGLLLWFMIEDRPKLKKS